jgi:hypothetical protein
MPDDVVILKMFSSEIEAGMAQQILQEGGVSAFVFKDDAGEMEPPSANCGRAVTGRACRRGAGQ